MHGEGEERKGKRRGKTPAVTIDAKKFITLINGLRNLTILYHFDQFVSRGSLLRV